VPLTADIQGYLSSTLTTLARLRPAGRTLSALVTIMAEQSRATEMRARAGRTDGQGISHPDQDLRALVARHQQVRAVLKRFTHDGDYGWLFDGSEERIQTHPIQTFELRTLMQLPRLVGPVLRHLFPRIEAQMTTDSPMLLLLDDAAIPWTIAKMEEKSREWMMTTRKKGVSLGFLTHSLSQVFSSSLGPLLTESCLTRFFLPNPAAASPQIAAIYAQLGLTPGEIRTVATARPHRDIYYSCEELGKRLFHLPLGPLALACYARNTAADHVLMDRLLAEEGPEEFPAAWLRAQGFPDVAQRLSAEVTYA
jgi:type IV secretion system protein TrbE